jgi:hypothetical protein
MASSHLVSAQQEKKKKKKYTFYYYLHSLWMHDASLLLTLPASRSDKLSQLALAHALLFITKNLVIFITLLAKLKQLVIQKLNYANSIGG